MTQLDKLKAIEAELNGQFVERRTEVRALLLCLLARQHLLLIGPPGTAKSMLVRTLADRLGVKVFQWLLTKFSTPEEIFGPVSVPGMKAGKYQRITTDKLPEAELAFIDETFKANSAILNSMLTVLNERLYHNNGAPVRVPLQFAVGASNEFPQGEELGALYDRFLVRLLVNPIADDGAFVSMLAGPAAAKATALDANELAFVQALAASIRVPQPVLDAMAALRRTLRAEGIVASDRRWRESLALVRAAALLAGHQEAQVSDLEVLQHILWSDAGHRDKAQGLVLSATNPHRKAAIELLDEARSVWGSTDPAAVQTGVAVELNDKLKDIFRRATEAAKASGSPEFDEVLDFCKGSRKSLRSAILGDAMEG